MQRKREREMSDYLSKDSHRERSKNPHPIWRGIGFMMIVFIPIISFAFADVVIRWAKQRGVTIPEELTRVAVNIPLYGQVNDLFAVLILAFAVMLVLFGIFTIINAAVYQATSHTNLQVFESKPQNYKKKRKFQKPRY